MKKFDPVDSRAWSITKSDKTDVIAQKGGRRIEGRSVFQFGNIFDEVASTSQVYDVMVLPILRGVVTGRNGTVFAYGQTSSGKTYTMQGSDSIHDGAGIIQMVARDLFRWIEEDSGNRDYTVRVSFIEIYNEKVRDLLGKESDENLQDTKARASSPSQSPTLVVREDRKRGGVYVDCQETVVEEASSMIDVLHVGNQNRAKASTSMNDQSSRSHAIFQITVESREKQKEGKSDDGRVVRISTLNLVDLAGSENGHQSGASGQRQREGGKINQRYEHPLCVTAMSIISQ